MDRLNSTAAIVATFAVVFVAAVIIGLLWAFVKAREFAVEQAEAEARGEGLSAFGQFIAAAAAVIAICLA